MEMTDWAGGFENERLCESGQGGRFGLAGVHSIS